MGMSTSGGPCGARARPAVGGCAPLPIHPAAIATLYALLGGGGLSPLVEEDRGADQEEDVLLDPHVREEGEEEQQDDVDAEPVREEGDDGVMLVRRAQAAEAAPQRIEQRE